MTRTPRSPKQVKVERSPALIPVPPTLKVLMRLVNSLPTALRRSEANGIHELTMRRWDADSEEEAINSWWYMWRYVDELPLNLQAFVLHEDDGRHVETGFGMQPRSDPYHLQPYQNIDLPGQTESELQEVVSRAKERINREIKIAQDRMAPSPQQDSTRRRDSLMQLPVSGWRDKYAVGDSTYSEVGPRRLLARARQRFFFILAAEEILEALTGAEPQKGLDHTWYSDESGAALRGHLFVQNDQVHLYSPVLFSFVLGLQVSRIHKCGICGNYFWAGRKDKKVCSEQCGATKRKRQERQRYFEIKLGDRIPKKRHGPKESTLEQRSPPVRGRDRIVKKGK